MPNFPKQASIYWFNPDPGKGKEIQKTRPCVVVSPDEMNEYLGTVIVAPVTSIIHSWPFRLTVNVLGQKSSIACDQIRAIDKSRLKNCIGDLRLVEKNKLLSLLQAVFSE